MKFTILDDPTTFFNVFRTKVKSAKRKIILSALYLGTDDEAMQLINDLHNAGKDPTRPNLEIKLLLDYSRTMRSQKDFERSIGPLCAGNINVHLFRMPQYQSWLSNSMNEILGVYHIKFFLFDDEVIISGANLNNEYFKDRQDRYVVIDHDALVSWFKRLTNTLVPYCYSVSRNLTIRPPARNSMTILKRKLLMLSVDSPIAMEASNGGSVGPPLSFAIPIFQHARIGIHTESYVLPRLMQSLSQPVLGNDHKSSPHSGSTTGVSGGGSDNSNNSLSVVISSPYPSYARALLNPFVSYLRPNSATRSLSFIMPASCSHGFHRGVGFKAWIPLLHQDTFYSSLYRSGLVDKRTCDALIDRAVTDQESTEQNNGASDSSVITIDSSSSSDVLRLCEYGREGWTYHAKGIWAFSNPSESQLPRRPSEISEAAGSIKNLLEYSIPASGAITSQFPCISYIGSSNLGSRSWGRDFELGFVLFSSDPVVYQQLHRECARILSHSRTLRLADRGGEFGDRSSGQLLRRIFHGRNSGLVGAMKRQWKRVAVAGLAWAIHTFL